MHTPPDIMIPDLITDPIASLLVAILNIIP
jgi:hypothetical protein